MRSDWVPGGRSSLLRRSLAELDARRSRAASRRRRMLRVAIPVLCAVAAFAAVLVLA